MNIRTFCCLQTIKKATLDGVLFRTEASQDKFRADNACVSEDYKESGSNSQVLVNYGIIKSMFLHSLGNEPEEIIVECDWYEKVGINPRTQLIQVRRNHNFDRCRVNFLKNLYPHNLVLWPSTATTPENGLLDVIYHHQ